MPWRTIQDEFGKFKWIDHEGRVYQGTPFAVEPDATAKTVFIASMMHAQEKPDVTCPSECERRKEVVRHEEVPGQPKAKKKKSSGNKKSNSTIKTKSTPVHRRQWLRRLGSASSVKLGCSNRHIFAERAACISDLSRMFNISA